MENLVGGLNEQQAAPELGVSVHALRQWRFKGRGPVYHKIGRRVVYYRPDLEDFKAAHRIQPGRAAA